MYGGGPPAVRSAPVLLACPALGLAAGRFEPAKKLLEGFMAMVVRMRKWSIPMCGLGRVSLDVFHWGVNWMWIDAVHYHIARSVFIRQHG